MKINCLQSPGVVCRKILFILFATVILVSSLEAQTATPAESASALYKQLQTPAFSKSVVLENAVLQRDRVRMTFSGTLYLAAPVVGKVRSAVFIGSGSFQAAPPPVLFEQENVRRLLKADDVSSDFKSAVLRFTDDSMDELLKGYSPVAAASVEQAAQMDHESGLRLLKETGINIASRQLGSILNQETPGMFLAQFAGGKRGHFSFVFDPQTRIPASNFEINAGEKGLIFAYDPDLFGNDVWMAFHSNDDYAKGTVSYSDASDLVATDKYTLKVDVTDQHKSMGETATMDFLSRASGVQVIPFGIGETLSTWEDYRLKRQLKVSKASLSDGTALTYFQEPWEGGFSVVLPKPVQSGEHFSITVELKGDFIMEPTKIYRVSELKTVNLTGMRFPISNETWYPRHGYLNRSKFDITIVHLKKDNVVSVGERVRDDVAPNMAEAALTEFRMEQPVALAVFAVGPYEIHKDVAKQESGRTLPMEFYSMPGDRFPIKEDFILAELNNGVRYFSKFFGEYQYPVFRGVFHPFGFGQGFATTIMMPNTDSGDYYTYSFIAHETSHQWWGDQVLWRSYQDQWLSEGFAEYSGMLYVGLRQNPEAKKTLIQRTRKSLVEPPETLQRIGKGRLVDVGPLIMGHRVRTRESLDAYTALDYGKGALVLRMLHFLFTDPQTGDGQPFVDLMSEFVRRYQGKSATSWDFIILANERLGNTPLAKRYGYKDLNWFYRQWVLQTYLPSYELTYHIEDNPAGGVIVKGEMVQTGIPENEKWFMPLPLVIHFGGGETAHTTVPALGPRTPIAFKLPKRPEKIELDPEMWVLSEKTTIKK